jgi:hypothetical protein
MEFITPFAKKKMEALTTDESRVVAYCNEAVGFSLGFTLAPPRIAQFKPGPTPEGGIPALNKDKYFSKRANKGANQYKFLLVPGTEIEVTYTDPNTFSMVKKNFKRKSISLSFDRTISVTEVKLWVIGMANNARPLLSKIYAVVTPSLKVHSVQSKTGDTAKKVTLTSDQIALMQTLGIRTT